MNTPENNEKQSKRVTLSQTPTHYIYHFNPPISEFLFKKVSWSGLNSYGGFAQRQSYRTLGGQGGHTIFFSFPKTADRDDIQAIFDRLKTCGVVEIELTTETYPCQKNDEELLWKSAEVITLEDHEELIENLQTAEGNSSEIDAIFQKLRTAPKQVAIEDTQTRHKRIINRPPKSRIVFKNRQGKILKKVLFI